jgi:hypothetical protein
MMSDEAGPRGRRTVTLGHENVNLPRLHGKERLVDGVDLKEDQGLRRFARLLIVVSHELDPAAQVFPKGEPDRPHAILECQFEKGNVLRPRFLELPPEKTGPDGERASGPTEGRPRDVELVPEFLDPCVDWKWCHTSSTHPAALVGKGHASPGAKKPKPPARETSLASAPPLAPAIGASTIGVWMPESGA